MNCNVCMGQGCPACEVNQNSADHHFIEIIQRLRKIHKPKYRHFCMEWDGLEIDEFCVEFNACTCFKELRG